MGLVVLVKEVECPSEIKIEKTLFMLVSMTAYSEVSWPGISKDPKASVFGA